jgi:hypothetical protein
MISPCLGVFQTTHDGTEFILVGEGKRYVIIGKILGSKAYIVPEFQDLSRA